MFFCLLCSFEILHTASNCTLYVKRTYDNSPHTGSCRIPVGSSRAYPQWYPVKLIHQTGFLRTLVGSVQAYISLCLSVLPRWFLAIICAARNFVQSMRLHTTGSNPLSDSIICPSVNPPSNLQDFSLKLALISSVGVQRVAMHIFDHRDLIVGPNINVSKYPPPILLWSVCLSVCLSVCRSGLQDRQAYPL